MSFDDAIEIEDYYAKKTSRAQQRDFIGRMERKLHNKEKHAGRD